MRRIPTQNPPVPFERDGRLFISITAVIDGEAADIVAPVGNPELFTRRILKLLPKVLFRHR